MKTKVISPLLLLSAIIFSSCATLDQVWYDIFWKKRDMEYYANINKIDSIYGVQLRQLEILESEIEERIDKNSGTVLKAQLPVVKKEKKRITKERKHVNDMRNDKKIDYGEIAYRTKEVLMKLKKNSEKIEVIQETVETAEDKVLQSDISFSTGSFKLKISGKEELEKFSRIIKKKVIEWNTKKDGIYKSRKKIIRINVDGYADLQGHYNTRIRKKRNQELSQKRAESVEVYLEELLTELKGEYNVVMIVNSKGLGETLPPNVQDAGKRNNPERRICIISSSVGLN